MDNSPEFAACCDSCCDEVKDRLERRDHPAFGAAPSTRAASPATLAIPTALSLSLIETAVKGGLTFAVSMFGGTFESLAVSQKALVQSLVSDSVLAFVAKLASDLETSAPTPSA